MSKRVTRFPAGFDYTYRPQSYFENLDAETLVVGSILGEERRKNVLRRFASGEVDPLAREEWLTESKLEPSTRLLLGGIHPALMGGEYLPPFGQNEIEIVRIVLASVTQDVISIRARRCDKRIAYRVVDEYENEFLLARKSSPKPLSFREVIKFIDQTHHEEDTNCSGLVLSVLDMNIEGSSDPESLRGFVTVSSSFYPELERYYNTATDQYLDQFVVEEDDAMD